MLCPGHEYFNARHHTASVLGTLMLFIAAASRAWAVKLSWPENACLCLLFISGEVGQTDLVYDQRSLVGLCMQVYKT